MTKSEWFAFQFGNWPECFLWVNFWFFHCFTSRFITFFWRHFEEGFSEISRLRERRIYSFVCKQSKFANFFRSNENIKIFQIKYLQNRLKQLFPYQKVSYIGQTKYNHICSIFRFQFECKYSLFKSGRHILVSRDVFECVTCTRARPSDEFRKVTRK